MPVGDKITAARYNALQRKALGVLGVGGTNPNTESADITFGYGNSLTSIPVISPNDAITLVTLAQIHSLRSDLQKIRKHQTGIDYGATGSISSDEYLASYTNISKTTDADWAKYELSASRSIDDRFLIHPTQGQTETFLSRPHGIGGQGGVRSIRTSTWNNELIHEISVDFRNYAEARYFFNAGGKIIHSPSLSYNGTDTKTNSWKTLLNNFITRIEFNYNTTKSFPTDITKQTTTTIGFYQLTGSTPVRIFIKSADAAYAGNYFEIEASTVTNPSAFLIVLRIRFYDGETSRVVDLTDPSTGVAYSYVNPDEFVQGTLTSEIQQFRPYGPDNSYVVVHGPAGYTTINSL